MKQLWMFTISIPNYMNDGKFNKQIFMYSDTCPTKEKIVELCEHEEAEECRLEEEGICPCMHEYREVLKSLEEIKEFPYLGSRLAHQGIPFESQRLKGEDSAVVSMSKMYPFEL